MFSITTKEESKLVLEALISTQVENAAWFADEIYTSIKQIEIFHFVHVTLPSANLPQMIKFKSLLNVGNPMLRMGDGRKNQDFKVISNRIARLKSTQVLIGYIRRTMYYLVIREFMNPNLNGREALNATLTTTDSLSKVLIFVLITHDK